MREKRELSRSEAVRQRRSRMNVKRLNQASHQAYKPIPPVTTRGIAYGIPKQKKKTTRHFNLSLLLPGVQPNSTRGFPGLLNPVRPGSSLVRVPRQELAWKLFSLTLSIGLSAMLYFAWSSPAFHANQALVTGNVRLSAEEVNSVLGISGRSVFELRPEEIVTRLRQNYREVDFAEAVVYFPNKVWIRMTERSPIIRWQQGEVYTWIDGSGVAFQPHGQVDGLIYIQAATTPPAGISNGEDPLNPAPYMAPELVEVIRTLAPHLPDGTPMQYQPQHGLGWTDSRGWEVYFGHSARNLALKLHIYYSLVDSLIGRGIYPSFISVEYPDAPYYRAADPDAENPADVDSE